MYFSLHKEEKSVSREAAKNAKERLVLVFYGYESPPLRDFAPSRETNFLHAGFQEKSVSRDAAKYAKGLL